MIEVLEQTVTFDESTSEYVVKAHFIDNEIQINDEPWEMEVYHRKQDQETAEIVLQNTINSVMGN